MSVKIRLMRVGKKKQPTYRVVVADSRSPRDGRVIDRIGVYAPLHDPSILKVDTERTLDWLMKGAQPTERVQKLIETTPVWDQFRAARPAATTSANKAIRAHVAAVPCGSTSEEWVSPGG